MADQTNTRSSTDGAGLLFKALVCWEGVIQRVFLFFLLSVLLLLLLASVVTIEFGFPRIP